MNRWSGARLLMTIAICATAAVIVGLLCVMVGSTGLGWPDKLQGRFRLESVMDSALVGAALAMAGTAYQAVLRNPLADPYLLGVSSGASLASYLWRLPAIATALGGLGVLAAASQQAFAFAGALIAVSIVLALGGRRGRLEPVTVLLVGVIVNAVNGSVFLLINAVARDLPGTGGALTFLVGGIQVITHAQRLGALLLVGAGWVGLICVSGQLNVAGLDDGEAQALGVHIHRLRWLALCIASVVTAAAVAISGPIGFVGLVCPHLGRLLVGPDQRRLLPTATALGAILLMVADATSRYLAAENRLGTQLQVGILTGLLGGSFFLWLLFDARRKR